VLACSKIRIGHDGGHAQAENGTVEIVGLGIMGGSFAQNLVAGGWRVVGYDIDPSRKRVMARAGVDMGGSSGLALTIEVSPPCCGLDKLPLGAGMRARITRGRAPGTRVA
jgi:hypothetical protein